MQQKGRTYLESLLAILLVVAALVLLSLFVPAIRDVAKDLASNDLKGLGTFGLFLAGLAAPIVFVFKKLGQGISGLLPSSKRERAIAAENERIKSELAEVRKKVSDLEEARRRDLEARERRIAGLEAQLALSRTELERTGRNIDRLEGAPLPSVGTAEMLEATKIAEDYVKIFD